MGGCPEVSMFFIAWENSNARNPRINNNASSPLLRSNFNTLHLVTDQYYC